MCPAREAVPLLMQSMRKTPLPSPAEAEGGGKRSPAKAPADPMAMLRKEVDIMRSLRHPNIVALHEVQALFLRLRVPSNPNTA